MDVTRRKALGAFVVVPVIGLVRAVRARRTGITPTMSTDCVAKADAAFADVCPDTKVGGCTVVRVGSVDRGGVPIVLRATGGETFCVDVLRHDDETPGIARAGSLALFLANGGTGEMRTHEEHGLAVMALAGLLGEREADGKPVPRLLTLRERLPLLGRS